MPKTRISLDSTFQSSLKALLSDSLGGLKLDQESSSWHLRRTCETFLCDIGDSDISAIIFLIVDPESLPD